MKCKYCSEILPDDDFTENYFHHLGANHYDTQNVEDKIMYDARKKMIQSKKDNELRKKADGDSDLIFNSQNSDI